jgi:hypothetical protein
MDFYKPDFGSVLEEKRHKGESISNIVVETFRKLPKDIWDEYIKKDRGFHFMLSDAVSIDRFLNNISDDELKEKYKNHKLPGGGWLLATDFDTINNYDWVVGTKHFNNLKWMLYEKIETKLNTYDSSTKSSMYSLFSLDEGITNINEFSKINISGEDFYDFTRYSKIIKREKEMAEKNKEENSHGSIHM